MPEQAHTKWLTTDQAAELTGYSVAYLRRLVRKGRVRARKVQREWLVDETNLVAYKGKMESLGRSKYTPHRNKVPADTVSS